MTFRYSFDDEDPETAERHRRLEDWVSRSHRMPFTLPGTVTASTSPPWPVDHGGKITKAVARLITAGSSTTTIKILVNGAQVGSDLTLGSGVYTGEVDNLKGELRPGDYVQVQVSGAGTGAADLTVVVVAQ